MSTLTGMVEKCKKALKEKFSIHWGGGGYTRDNHTHFSKTLAAARTQNEKKCTDSISIILAP